MFTEQKRLRWGFLYIDYPWLATLWRNIGFICYSTCVYIASGTGTVGLLPTAWPNVFSGSLNQNVLGH